MAWSSPQTEIKCGSVAPASAQTENTFDPSIDPSDASAASADVLHQTRPGHNGRWLLCPRQSGVPRPEADQTSDGCCTDYMESESAPPDTPRQKALPRHVQNALRDSPRNTEYRASRLRAGHRTHRRSNSIAPARIPAFLHARPTAAGSKAAWSAQSDCALPLEAWRQRLKSQLRPTWQPQWFQYLASNV